VTENRRTEPQVVCSDGAASTPPESNSGASFLIHFCPVVLAFMPPKRGKHSTKNTGTKAAFEDSFPYLHPTAENRTFKILYREIADHVNVF
jgi:hypothetical protein